MSDTTQTPWCCHTGCEKPAAYRIVYGDQSDDYTEACARHVDDLKEPDAENVVYVIGTETRVDVVHGVIINRESMTAVFPSGYPDLEDFVASFLETEEKPDCNRCGLYQHDIQVSPCFDCRGMTGSPRSYFKRRLLYTPGMNNDPSAHALTHPGGGAAFAVDVSGLPEFDQLLTLLQTIYLMAADERVRAFIEAEVQQLAASLSDRPLTHTFDLLAEAQRRPLQLTEEQRTYIHAAAVDLSVPISYLDDARGIAIEGTAEYAVLETLQKYLEALAVNDQTNN